jgi:hypothetical protein
MTIGYRGTVKYLSLALVGLGLVAAAVIFLTRSQPDPAKEERLVKTIRGSWLYVGGKDVDSKEDRAVDEVAAVLLQRPSELSGLSSEQFGALAHFLGAFGQHFLVNLSIGEGRTISAWKAFLDKETKEWRRLGSSADDGWNGTWFINRRSSASDNTITIQIPKGNKNPARTLRLELVRSDDTHLKVRNPAGKNTSAVAVFTRIDAFPKDDQRP